MTIYFVLKLMVVSRGRLRLYTRCVYITVQHEEVWIYVGYASINTVLQNVNILNFRVKDFNCGMESFLID